MRESPLLLGMQHVPTLGFEPIAPQFRETRHAEDVRRHAEVLLQHVGRRQHLAQDRSTSQELDTRARALGGANRVHPLEDPRLDPGRHGRLRVFLVHDRDVVEDVFLFDEHPPQAVLHDHGQLVRIRRVVADAVGDRRRQNVTVAILVLEAFARQGGPTRRAPEQEAPHLHVTRRPGQVVGALETEHRVVDVEGHHRDAVARVGGARRDPRRHGPGFVDALLQDLALLVFPVVGHLVGVDGLVQLADRGVDGKAPEHPFHPEGSRLVRHDGDDVRADLLVPGQELQDADGRHRRRDLAFSAALDQGLEEFEVRHLEGGRFAVTNREIAAEGPPALVQVLDFRAVRIRQVEGCLGDLGVRHRNVEAIPEGLEGLLSHLVLLVGDVLPLARLAHAVALHGLRQYDRGLPFVLDRRRVGREQLVGIVTAAVQAPDVVVREVRDHLGQLGVLPEEVLARVGPAASLVVLVLAVAGLVHALAQQAVLVLCEQGVPVAAPDHLDDVPTVAPEGRLEFLDDLAVAANRAVQTLEVAVHHEDQVVEFLAAGKRQASQALRLVALAVTQEGPHLAVLAGQQSAVLHVLEKARLVDRHQRPQAHGNRGELPEIRHQARMRIGGEPAPVDLLAEAVQLVFADAPLEKRTRVDARRRVALDVQEISSEVAARCSKEVIEADVVEGRGRREARDVSAQGRIDPVRLHDHCHGVPANDRANAVLDGVIAGAPAFLGLGDGVHVGGVRAVREIGSLATRPSDQPAHQVVGALDSLLLEDRVESVEPLPGLLGIAIRRQRHSTTSVGAVGDADSRLGSRSAPRDQGYLPGHAGRSGRCRRMPRSRVGSPLSRAS